MLGNINMQTVCIMSAAPCGQYQDKSWQGYAPHSLYHDNCVSAPHSLYHDKIVSAPHGLFHDKSVSVTCSLYHDKYVVYMVSCVTPLICVMFSDILHNITWYMSILTLIGYTCITPVFLHMHV